MAPPNRPSLADLMPRSASESVAGVVIDLPQSLIEQIQPVRLACDPVTALTAPHITLMPPRRIDNSRWDAVQAHLSSVAAQATPFEVRLNGTGTFRPLSPVAFLNVEGDLEALARVQSQVCSGPLEGDLPYSFHPHVTLAHRVPDAAIDEAMAALADYRAAFTVDALAIFVKSDDGSWQCRHRLPFRG